MIFYFIGSALLNPDFRHQKILRREIRALALFPSWKTNWNRHQRRASIEAGTHKDRLFAGEKRTPVRKGSEISDKEGRWGADFKAFFRLDLLLLHWTEKQPRKQNRTACLWISIAWAISKIKWLRKGIRRSKGISAETNWIASLYSASLTGTTFIQTARKCRCGTHTYYIDSMA